MDRHWLTMMARYNMWQNGWILDACGSLDAAVLERDGGAFFGSIGRTLRHVLWADAVWMSRFGAATPPDPGARDGSHQIGDWPGFAAARRAMDARILDWAARARCDGDIAWHSGSLGTEVTQPRAVIFTHFFNHQTHHRGQVHALLTAAGVKTDDTDLVFMSDQPKETT